MSKITNNEFAMSVDRTRNAHSSQKELICNYSMGLAGETGEAVDIMKKYCFHGSGLNADHFREEMGDVLFYLVGLLNALGMTVEECMEDNKLKLERRYPTGFTEGGGVR